METDAVTTVQCYQHARNEGKNLEFLLITDQVGSSANPHNDVRPKTGRHFNEFIPALPASATVIKNIGDSLMIHVRLNANELPMFLDGVLTAKLELDGEKPDPRNRADHMPDVPLRIVMVHLDPSEYLCGHEIAWQPTSAPIADIPQRRTDGCCSWLCGDLFGSSVALAFRASGIPKSGIVVIDDRIVSQWKGGQSAESFSCSLPNERLLCLGPALAFSPFKGLEDIYRFGGKGPTTESGWRGHLFMRMVGHSESAVNYTSKNALVKDQQKVRVFTEIVWSGPAPLAKCSALVEALEAKQKNAGYIRDYGRVLTTEDFPSNTLSHETDVILIGAYPSPEAYAVIRSELDADSLISETGFAYPVTNEVYPDKAEMEKAFLVPGVLTEKYLLMFARWKAADRRNHAQTAKMKLDAALQGCGWNGNLAITNCGLIQGNLWDVYALFSINVQPVEDTALVKMLSKAIRKQQSFEAATLKLCQSMPHHG